MKQTAHTLAALRALLYSLTVLTSISTIMLSLMVTLDQLL